MRLFAMKGSNTLGAAVARVLGAELDALEERDFADGEHKTRPLVSVRGEDVYVLHSLAGDDSASVNDKLVKLLFFIAACRDNGAVSVTAVVPYLAYARKDRQTKVHDPVTTRYTAQLFEAVGADRIIALDVHNLAAFQNAFRCQTIHLDARQLFCSTMRDLAKDIPVVVFSPDGGGVKRAELLRQAYEAKTRGEAGFGFMEKRRSRGVVSGDLFAGNVDGKAVFLADDMISTGGTMLRAARACRARGAASVHAMATHGLFGKGAEALFADGVIDRIVVTDSLVSASRMAQIHAERLEVVSSAALFAQAIKRLHANQSMSGLLGMEN